MYKRSEKVAEAVHEMISELLVKGVKDPRIGFVTITAVKVTDDLHIAHVYFTVIGSEAEKKATEAGLNSAKGFFRKEMGKNLRMRYVPELIFKYDKVIEQSSRIEGILKEISGAADKGDDDR